MLLWILFLPFVGGLLAWVAGALGRAWPRWISLAALAGELALALRLWPGSRGPAGAEWLAEVNGSWIPMFGIRFHLGMDGLSLVMVSLTAFLGMLAVAASWTEVQERVGFFHFNLLWTLAGITGVFLALDLFLFYVLWEVMLVPMYLLIGIWGHENRVYAAVKFFIFTQASGLLMLLAIWGLYFVHGQSTGVYTFDYMELLGTAIPVSTQWWLMLGFLIAFAVKLPVLPLHNWLPDAHTAAPTGGSVLLAGLLLKTGAYGLLRFVLPLFPDAAGAFAPIAWTLGVAGILYGAVLAFAQNDFKRLVAYTSVSHMGFVLLGAFSGNALALQGVVMQMVCHGLSTGGLFMLAGMFQERTHTRDLNLLGGLWATVPRLGGVGLVLALASLGLPGMGNFVGEFLVLAGTFQVSRVAAIAAALGLIFSAVYALWIVQRTFHGTREKEWSLPDLSIREGVVAAALVLSLVWLGLGPQPVLDAAQPALNTVERATLSAGANLWR